MILIGLVVVFLGFMLELPWVHVCGRSSKILPFYDSRYEGLHSALNSHVWTKSERCSVTKNYFPKIILDINVVNVCLPCERIESE